MVVLDAQLFLQPQIVPHKANCLDYATVSSVSARVSQRTMRTVSDSLTHSHTHSLSQKYYIYIGRLYGQTSCLRRLNSLTGGCVTWLALQTLTAVTPLVFPKATNPHSSVIYTPGCPGRRPSDTTREKDSPRIDWLEVTQRWPESEGETRLILSAPLNM
jgi:hypothetical protein